MTPSPFRSSFPARCAVLAGIALLLACSLFALDVPPAPAQWLTDNARILDSTQADALNQKLRAFEEQSGAQFLIYIFPTLENEALEDFTIRCAEKWKAGQKKYDNGVILFVFVKEKKIRLEVGYGLEPTITDAFSSEVIRNDVAPHFKDGDYAGGLNAGADAVMAKIRGTEAPVPVQKSGPSSGSGSSIDPIFLLAIVVIFLFFILPLLRRGGGCGGGGCGGCWPMFIPWGGFGGGGGSTFGGGSFGGGGGGFSGGGGGFGGGGASGGW